MLKQQLRHILTGKISGQEIEQWFDPLVMSRLDAYSILVEFPHQLFFEWFSVKFKNIFENALNCFGGSAIEPVYVLYGCAEKQQKHSPGATVISGANMQAPSTAQTLEVAGYTGVWNNDCSNDYSFENFIFNRKNQYPVDAAKEFSRFEGPNPFTIFSATGCGKTHILSAIYKVIKNIVPENMIFFGKLSELETIIKNNYKSKNHFFFPFLGIKAFIIDNFQECSAKPDLQKSLVTLIEICSEQNIRLALSLDTVPESWGYMQDKLRSMLESGLIIEIKKPDMDIKTRYVREQSALLGLSLKKEDVFELARIYNEFRQILGALLKIYSFKSHAPEGMKINLETILKNSRPEIKQTITPEIVINFVSKYFNLNADDLKGKNRSKEVTFARHMAMYLLRDILMVPLSSIGEIMKRDHSSVIYSINKIKQLLKTNDEMNKTATTLKNLCTSSDTVKRYVR